MTHTKTLLISEIFPPLHGGSGRWFHELYSRLPREDYLIAAGQTDGDRHFDREHDLAISRLPLSSTAWGVVSRTGLAFYWRNFRRLRRLVRQNAVSHIHCGRCLPEGVFGLLMQRFYRIPYLCYVHGEDIEAASCSRELSYIVRQVLTGAGVLIANSNNTRDLLLDHWQVPPDKVVVLNPGMDASRFVPAAPDPDIRRQLGWDDRPVLLTVGRLQQRKGQDMLIRALPLIRQRFPDILYTIVGNGEEYDTLRALTDELDLAGNVQFLADIPDERMIQCYQQCTLFVLPNRTIGKDIEGFGMVLAEAQSCGRPVLAGDSGGTAETMRQGETGFITDCTAPEPLAAKIIDMLSAPERLRDMGEKARQHALANLDWNTHVSRAQRIFASLAGADGRD